MTRMNLMSRQKKQRLLEPESVESTRVSYALMLLKLRRLTMLKQYESSLTYTKTIAS